MAFISQRVNLSSGQILFNDPTKPWQPENFPVFPSTGLALTANAKIENGNINQVVLGNNILYEPYESNYKPVLNKSFTITNQGFVNYEETKVGIVSTVVSAFQSTIQTFTTSAIGGINIQDSTTPKPDTITNALGKIDGWITHAFLVQPPAVTVTSIESSSLFSGVQWETFVVWPILDKSVPYVSNIVFVIGDPTTANYLTFEVNDSTFFPFQMYTNGISPYYNPLVKLRIFTNFFPTTADLLFTKSGAQNYCIRIIQESGVCTLPPFGKVFAINKTDGADTFTTLSIYLPQLQNVYPKGTPIPVSISYINKTIPPPNITFTSTIQKTTGAPSRPLDPMGVGSAPTTVSYNISSATYSDASANITDPYFMNYQTNYKVMEPLVAHCSGTGYSYGTPNQYTLPSTLSTFYNTLASTATNYTGSQQNIVVPNLPPAAIFSTAVNVTNYVGISGPYTNVGYLSTLFPSVTIPNISSATLQPNQSQLVSRIQMYNANYSALNGWSIATNVDADVLFISSATNFQFVSPLPIQLNDSSYPGDRSTFTLKTSVSTNTGILYTDTLLISSYNQDFRLGSPITMTNSQGFFNVVLADTQTLSTNVKYFYNMSIEGGVTVSTVYLELKNLYLTLTNKQITNYCGPIIQQTVNSIPYRFYTDYTNTHDTFKIVYNNTCLSNTFITGILTPSVSSIFLYDLYGFNFAYNFFANAFGTGQLFLDPNTDNELPGGPQATYTSNTRIYSYGSQITTLPIQSTAIVYLSSIGVTVNPNVYTDPASPGTVGIAANLIPANPNVLPVPVLYDFGSGCFIDTLSQTIRSQFPQSTNTVYGELIQSWLPRNDGGIVVSSSNIQDDVDSMGQLGDGGNTQYTDYVTVTPGNIEISSGIYYNHQSTLQTNYQDFYSRGLLFTGGHYIHPAGYNFTPFTGSLLGRPSITYPNFTNDLSTDVNFGYRYVSFLYITSNMVEPTPYQFVNVRIITPNNVSTITEVRDDNNYFPDVPVQETLVSSMKVRMHLKIFGAYDNGMYETIESSWINGFKLINEYIYDDSIYDVGGALTVTHIGPDAEYKVRINRRFYTQVATIVRIGIARDASPASPYDPITFTAVQTSLSDT